MSATRSTLNVGLILLGVGTLALLIAKTAKGKEPSLPREGTTPEDVPPSEETMTVFSVNGRSYRLIRSDSKHYIVELLDATGVLARYHYGPDGLEAVDGDPDQVALIARDMPSFPKDIPEFNPPIVPPPENSPVDYVPLS